MHPRNVRKIGANVWAWSKSHPVISAIFALITLGICAWLIYGLISNPSFRSGTVWFWLQIIAPGILYLVQVASLIFLIVYVIKTANIAESNRRAAEATRDSALLSRETLGEMRKTREEEAAPYVIVYIDIRDFRVDLVMENIGRTMAYNISLLFTPTLPKELVIGNSMPAFLTGETPSLAPGQHMRRILNSSAGVFALGDQGLPLRYEVMVTYERAISGSEQRRHRFVLDIESFRGVTFRDDKLIKSIADGLKSVSEGIHKDTEALKNIGEHLEDGLTVTSALIHRVEKDSPEEYVNQFRHLCASLSAELRIWGSKAEQDRFNSASLIIERINLVTTEMAYIAPYLPANADTIDRVRSLAYDLRSAGHWFQYYMDPSDQAASIVRQLSDIADGISTGEPFPEIAEVHEAPQRTLSNVDGEAAATEGDHSGA